MLENIESILARLTAMDMGQPCESPPIRRAVANLLTAMRNRAEAGDFNDDKALEIAAILDEAASRIERL